MNTKRMWWLLATAVMLVALVPSAHAFYDPGTQRWINRDPIGEHGGWNVVAYCLNEPVSKVDALGLLIMPPLRPPSPPQEDAELEAAKKWLKKCMPGLCKGPVGIDYPVIASPWLPWYGTALVPGVVVIDRPSHRDTEDLVATIAHECGHKFRGRGVNLYGVAIADSFTGMHDWLGDEFEQQVRQAYRKDPNGDKCCEKTK